MTYQTTFVSSEFEERKRRALLSGARRFYFMGHEFHYAYSSNLMVLKEEIGESLFKIERTLARLGEKIRNEYERSCLLDEVFCSCGLDGYPYSKKLEWLYFKNKPMDVKYRTMPLKNLSLAVGFSPSSPCKTHNDIKKGLETLKELRGVFKKEDILIWTLIEHFLFEYIHPLETRNGIFGRYRVHKNLKGTPYEFLGMRFAASFSNGKKDYFLSFKRSELTFDLNDYLELLLSKINDEISKCLQDLREKEKRWNAFVKRMESMHFKGGELLTLKGMAMMKIFTRQKINLSRLARILNKSERSVFRHVLRLKRLGFDGFDTPK